MPGEHAFVEARDALRAGLHVMLFSDNVPIEQEIALKSESARRGLLVMGPDCGTAVLGGVGLGFRAAQDERREQVRPVRPHPECDVAADRYAGDDRLADTEFIEQLGPAINSAKSMFLYGDSGNGKTNMAESIARMLGGDLYVPYAVDVGGQIIVVYDPVYHRALPDSEEGARNGDEPDWLESAPAFDQRFARVHRPVVFTGGELTLEDLDLQYDTTSKIYQAPFQVKANGGVLIIDDFGRQRVRPRDLLRGDARDVVTVHEQRHQVASGSIPNVAASLQPRPVQHTGRARSDG